MSKEDNKVQDQMLQIMSTLVSRLDGMEKKFEEMSTTRSRTTHAGTRPPPVETRTFIADPPRMNDPKVDLIDRIQMALEIHSDTEEIRKAVGETFDRTLTTLQTLHADNQIANLGGDVPIWAWKRGTKTDQATLTKDLVRLLQRRPMANRDMATLTGATPTQVQNAIVEIRRHFGDRLDDLNTTGHDHLYFLYPEFTRDVSLPKRSRKRVAKDAKR